MENEGRDTIRAILRLALHVEQFTSGCWCMLRLFLLLLDLLNADYFSKIRLTGEYEGFLHTEAQTNGRHSIFEEEQTNK